MTVVTGATTTSSNTTTSPTSTSSSSTSTSTSPTINYDQYLQLLIAQLKNQDPTSPQDSTAFVSQLASFSSVEQQVQTNNTLNSLLTSQQLSQASSVIGFDVTSADGSVSGQVASVTISSGAAQATLTNGQTITLGAGIKISPPTSNG